MEIRIAFFCLLLCVFVLLIIYDIKVYSESSAQNPEKSFHIESLHLWKE